MTDGLTATKTTVIDRSMLRGGLVLLAVGGVVCMAGGLVVTAAVVGTARTWVRQWDEPPSAKARRRYAQARSAAVAGAQGWKQNSREQAEPSMSGGV